MHVYLKTNNSFVYVYVHIWLHIKFDIVSKKSSLFVLSKQCLYFFFFTTTHSLYEFYLQHANKDGHFAVDEVFQYNDSVQFKEEDIMV